MIFLFATLGNLCLMNLMYIKLVTIEIKGSSKCFVTHNRTCTSTIPIARFAINVFLLHYLFIFMTLAGTSLHNRCMPSY